MPYALTEYFHWKFKTLNLTDLFFIFYFVMQESQKIENAFCTTNLTYWSLTLFVIGFSDVFTKRLSQLWAKHKNEGNTIRKLLGIRRVRANFSLSICWSTFWIKFKYTHLNRCTYFSLQNKNALHNFIK